MAWVDSMRLRQRADKVRAIGWFNLLFSVVWAVLESNENDIVMLVAAVWAALVMAATHVAAWFLDKHADKVVRR